MLGRRDVGHRIVIRRIVGNQSGRTLFSDALGELVELNETHLTLATANGPLRVPLGEVHRAKRVPPARRPNATAVVELELASDEAWPAPVRERLGDWLLRTAEGWSGRANTALPVGDPDRPLDEAIDAVVSWYAGHGRPAMVNVPLPLAAPVGAALDERGWSARPLVLVQTAPLTAILAEVPARTDLPAPELAARPSPEWYALAAQRKAAQRRQYARLDAAAAGDRRANGGGQPAEPVTPAELPAAARHILTAVPQVRFVHLYGPPSGDHPDGGPELVAAARGTVTGPGRWLGLSLIEVVPSARRRGLAQHMIRALAEWAAGLGATRAFLQVEERNEAAVALYRRIGFTTHHTYQTRVAPG